MRFRQHAVAVPADIAEMFMQISIRPEDRVALRYLWREDAEAPPTEYRMKSMIIGATSSSATAIYIKNLNVEKHRCDYPEAADAIVRNHYMDDYLGSYRTPEDAIRIAVLDEMESTQAKQQKKSLKEFENDIKKFEKVSKELLYRSMSLNIHDDDF